MTRAEISRLAAITHTRGGKLKHWREALPHLDDQILKLIRREAIRITQLRDQRASWHRHIDPLILVARSRHECTPSAIAARERDFEEMQARRRAEADAARQAVERAERAREAVKQAARIARSLGLHVRASRDQSGRVSSYYVSRPSGGPPLRISDHEIPASEHRHSVALMHGDVGGYAGYHGPEIIFRGARSKTWIRRALMLALDGRLVPIDFHHRML